LFFTKKSTESIIPDGAARSDQYRMVIENGDTMLFNMRLDPGQKDDISSREKDVTTSLVMAYNDWFTEVTNEFEPTTEIRIGFEEEQRAYLPAHEAGFSGDIHFMEGHGWAHDWLVNWQNIQDSIYWDVVVEQATSFELELLYSCPEEQIGSSLSVAVGGSHLEASLSVPHDPDYLPSPDRIQRIEVYEKEWASLVLGSFTIPRGNQQIVLKADMIPDEQVGDIKGLKLSRVIP
jgi:arylsulfatase A